jgi:hypothetical protein
LKRRVAAHRERHAVKLAKRRYPHVTPDPEEAGDASTLRERPEAPDRLERVAPEVTRAVGGVTFERRERAQRYRLRHVDLRCGGSASRHPLRRQHRRVGAHAVEAP